METEENVHKENPMKNATKIKEISSFRIIKPKERNIVFSTAVERKKVNQIIILKENLKFRKWITFNYEDKLYPEK